MKKRIELLAGLIEEDDFETTRQDVVESYVDQMEEDVQLFCEHVSVVEEDEYRMDRMLSMGEDVEVNKGLLKENAYVAPQGEYSIAHGHGLGPGFAAWDGQKKEVYDPFRASSVSSKWYLEEGNFEEDEARSDRIKYNIEKTNQILDKTEKKHSDGISLIDIVKKYENTRDEDEEEEDWLMRLSNLILYNEIPETNNLSKKQRLKWSSTLRSHVSSLKREKKEEEEMYADMPPEDDSRWKKESNLKAGDNYEVGYGLGVGPGFANFQNRWNIHEEVKLEEMAPEHINGNISEYFHMGNDGEYDVYTPNKNSEYIRLGLKESENGYTVVGILMSKNELSSFSEGNGKNMEDALDDALSQLNEMMNNLLPLDAIDAMSDLRAGNDIIVNNNTILREDLIRMRMISITENGFDLTRKGNKYLTKVVDGMKMLNESEAGRTPTNAWFYDRVGTTDSSNLRFRENPYGDDPPRMHPNQPEQPSLQDGPGGLVGWKFYENSPDFIKMDAKASDPLDMGITKASEEAYNKFWERYSVYGKPTKKKKVNESSGFPGYRSYEEAAEAKVSKKDAIRELLKHDIGMEPEEMIKLFFEEVGEKDWYHGEEVLGWLGY